MLRSDIKICPSATDPLFQARYATGNGCFSSIRTYTYKIEADNRLHNCVCGALSIKDGGVINILAKLLRRRTIELQCVDDFTS